MAGTGSRYIPGGNRTRTTTSFVREADITKASTDVATTLSDFEKDLRTIEDKYTQARRKSELELLRQQKAQLEAMYVDAATKARQIQIQTENEVASLRLKGIEVGAATEAAIKLKNQKARELEEKKAILKTFEELNKKNQAARDLELKRIEALVTMNNPDATEAEKKAAKQVVAQQDWMKSLGESTSKAISHAMNEISNEINHVMDKYGEYTENINTRLQGSLKNFYLMEKEFSLAVGIQPYFRTEDMLDSLEELVAQGINYNVEQRAFLNVLSEKVADTFDAANASLLRIVRLQQSDSTAARLGMESFLTSYLNFMFENTEYLNTAFDGVQEAILAASSQMTNENAVAFEYQVQKWLGSLYSVGMSDQTVQGIAEALGYLGSGNITALNNSTMQSLLVMAASRAGLSYADLLSRGLNESTTNVLLQSLIQYMQEIGSSSSNVVRSQFAEAFGVSISDLTAALNLNTQTLKAVSSSSMSYAADIANLNAQTMAIITRTSMAEMVNNLFANAKFSLASGVASNPVLSALWKVTDMIENYTGGINIPGFGSWVFGNGFELDLNASIEGLMKLGIMGIGSLGMIGDVIGGLASSVLPASMLWRMGVGVTPTTTKRGMGLISTSSGMTTSSSALVGNASGSDFSDSTLNAANDDANKTLEEKQAKQKEENADEKTITDLIDYLTQHIETKFDIMVAMSARQAGYSMTAGEAVFTPDKYMTYIGGKETAVVVSAPTGDEAKTTANYLAAIEEGVVDILAEIRDISDKLDTISSKMNSYGASYLGGAGSAGGIGG